FALSRRHEPRRDCGSGKSSSSDSEVATVSRSPSIPPSDGKGIDMNPNTHERAWGLIDALLVEGIATSESEWLEAHLANCPGCQVKARANERALQVLRSNG